MKRWFGMLASLLKEAFIGSEFDFDAANRRAKEKLLAGIKSGVDF